MRVLIVGGGHAGLGLAIQLARAGHDVALLDREPAVVRNATDRHGLVALPGDATDAAVLDDAEVSRMDVVVTMLRRDADNLAVALLARARGVQQIMVRIRDAAYRAVYQAAGVTRVLSETEILVSALATSVEYPTVLHAMYLGDGSSVAFEVMIPEGAALDGMSVVEVARLPDFPQSCVFAGLHGDDGQVHPPRGGSVLKAGRVVLIVARRDELGKVTAFLERRG